jgi:transcription elongation factor SPT6
MEKKSEKIEEIADLIDYVNLRYAQDISRSQKYSKGPKRPVNRSLYNMSMNSKVKDFVSVSVCTHLHRIQLKLTKLQSQ